MLILTEALWGSQVSIVKEAASMKTQRLELTFPEKLIKKPIIYELVRDFNVIPNIRRANVDENFGWMVLELSGEDDKLEEAFKHLQDIGVEVEYLDSFVE